MNLSIKRVTPSTRSTLEHLWQLYRHDLSELDRRNLGADGLFDNTDLNYLLDDPANMALLIGADDEIAGFVIVESRTFILEQGTAKAVGEYFIARKYRRQRIGETIAFGLFERYKGKWEVRAPRGSDAASRFWRTIVERYSKGQYSVAEVSYAAWGGTIYTFDAEGIAASPNPGS